MTSVQSTVQFPIKKKSSFYGSKNIIEKQDFTRATVGSTPSIERYTPSVTKIMTISSSDSESDSDNENINTKSRKNVNNTSRTCRRTKHASSSDDDHSSTPPKQRRTLQSPRTPTALLDRLNLDSSSEQDKVQFTPKKLFDSGKYRIARKALHSSAPEHLPGRQIELAELHTFIQEHLNNESSGSLYVSGPPGTGKTASLSKIMQKKEFENAFQIIYINCTKMKSACAIYSAILDELNVTHSKSGKNNKALIEKYLVTSHKMIFLVLDEIDQLESKRQTVLYSIFEWPAIPKSKLLLVGIANALDLTDRILPRLQARCELKPKLMHFAPYTKQQIVNIITERLKEAEVCDIFTGMAIQLLAGKVAAISGDVRRALDISRRVVELAESQKSASVLQPAVDNFNNGGGPKKQELVSDKPVDLKEIITVLNSVYGGSQNVEQDKDTFPLQQKLLLCSLMLILNKGRNKDVTVSKLHQVYEKVCKKRNIHSVDISEFIGLCSLIETRGIFRIVGKKAARLAKVNLQWDQQELSIALQDKKMTEEIINDNACL